MTELADQPDASSQFADSLPIHPDDLLDRLQQAEIAFEHFHHVPLRTVADSKQVRDDMLSRAEGGGHIKNLYLRDKKKNQFLVVLDEDRQVDLKALEQTLGANRLSFGSADRLLENLGVRPGAVTPLSMMTGKDKNVRLVLDASLKQTQVIYVHPLVNDQTLGLSPEGLIRFIEHLGVEPEWVDFDSL